MGLDDAKSNNVSVVILTNDRPVTIFERSLRSVVQQTVLPSEIIVVDTGSDWNLKKEKASVSDALIPKDVGFEYLCEKNTPSARNSGAELCKGDYISFLDDDDEWYQEKLEKQLSVLKDDVSLVASHYVQEGGKCPVRATTERESILARNWVGCTSFPLIERRRFMDVGGFDHCMKANQEWELWMRMLDKGDVVFTEGELGIKHLSENSVSMGRSRRRQGWLRLFTKHFKDYLCDLESLHIALDYCFREMYRLKAYCSS